MNLRCKLEEKRSAVLCSSGNWVCFLSSMHPLWWYEDDADDADDYDDGDYADNYDDADDADNYDDGDVDQ